MSLRNHWLSGLAFTLICTFAIAGVANEQTAQALAEKGASFLKEHDLDAAKTAFSDMNGEWVQGDLYLFVIDENGTMVIHGNNPNLVGKDLSNLKSIDGVYFVKEMAAIAKSGGAGWVTYQWKNPESGKIGNKRSYMVAVPSAKVAVGAGYYYE